MVTIANVVGSGGIGIELDVEAVQADLVVPFSEYDPSNYHGLYVRLEEGGPLITIFRSGKYIISGCSSIDELQATNREFLRNLAELDIVDPTSDTGFTVQNIVCIGELNRVIDLNALSIGLGLEATEYEPEQFPGLVYRPSTHTVVLLVFASGKVVITGTPDIQKVEEAFDHLKSRVDTVTGI